MRELARSAQRFAWSTACLGAEGMTLLAAPGGPARLRASCDDLATAARGGLGTVMDVVFRTGEELGREWIDLAADGLDPNRWGRAIDRGGADATELLRLLSPDGDGRTARRELRNKLEVYLLVRQARRRVGLPATGPFELAEAVDRAYRRAPYDALWLVEGLAHDDAAARLVGASPAGAGRRLADLDLPPASRDLAHSGLGLAAAETVLRGLRPAAPLAAYDDACRRFVALCRAEAAPAHLDAALESFGLVARCFFPESVPGLGRALAAGEDRALEGYFWHGLGRAIYFTPLHFVPGYGSYLRAVRAARREAPEGRPRHNATAGVGYAVAMVNLADPEVIAGVLARHPDAVDDAFVEGVLSALLVRHSTTPDDPAVAAFLSHRPAAGADAWRRRVVEPCRRLLAGEGATGSGDVSRALAAGGRR